ncbi:MAG TPA: tetratricopeptide repeat protein [Candidatus Limnocylindrales bacterium]|nr:tetratricopeptide repeat protein [Candidatus Limnocylindrales bacterium]
MRVQCSHCGAQGNVDAAKIPPQGANIKCPRCQNIFFIKKEDSTSTPPSGWEEVSTSFSERAVKKESASPPISEEALESPLAKVASEMAVQEADKAAQQGMDFLKKRMFDEALKSFQRVVELNPRHLDGYRNLGVIYGQKKMWSEALKALEKAVEINPDDLQSQKNLSVLYLQQKNFEAAIPILEKVLTLTPYDEKAKNYLALALKGKKSQSRPTLENPPIQKEILEVPSSSSISPSPMIQKEPKAETEQVSTLASEGPGEEIKAEVSESLNPESREVGSSRQRLKPEPAINSKVSSLLDEACDLLDSQRPRDAIAKCKEALQIEPNNPSIYYMMGLIYEERQMWDQAREVYEKALQLKPDYEEVRLNLGLIRKQRKKPIWKIWARK